MGNNKKRKPQKKKPAQVTSNPIEGESSNIEVIEKNESLIETVKVEEKSTTCDEKSPNLETSIEVKEIQEEIKKFEDVKLEECETIIAETKEDAKVIKIIHINPTLAFMLNSNKKILKFKISPTRKLLVQKINFEP